MKWKNCTGLAAVLWLCVSIVRGQELLIDQASGTLEEPIVNGSLIPENEIAQSFTPSLSGVGFVQFRTLVVQPGANTVTIVVELREATFNGPIISSTAPVVLPPFSNLGTFYFLDNVPLTPGQLYFFQPVLQSAGSLSIGYNDFSTYDRGQPWFNGGPSGPGDLWFREGIVVPEPPVFALLSLGAGIILVLRKPSL